MPLVPRLVASAAERRRQQAMVRLQRDLREAEKRAGQAEQAQAVTAEAFEESQRALAEAEMAVADLGRTGAHRTNPRPGQARQPTHPGRGYESRRRSAACRAAGRGPLALSRRCRRPASARKSRGSPPGAGLHRPHEPSADGPAVGPRPGAGRRDPGRRTVPPSCAGSHNPSGGSTVRHPVRGRARWDCPRGGTTVRSRS